MAAIYIKLSFHGVGKPNLILALGLIYNNFNNDFNYNFIITPQLQSLKVWNSFKLLSITKVFINCMNPLKQFLDCNHPQENVKIKTWRPCWYDKQKKTNEKYFVNDHQHGGYDVTCNRRMNARNFTDNVYKRLLEH
jgi:hypothetical protein